jgi:hypothetical protein
MIRLRLASWAALAGLGLVAGCQSPSTCCNPCNTGCGLFQGGLINRMRPRCDTCCPGPALGSPVEGVPVSNGFPVGEGGAPGCPTFNGGGPPLPTGDVPFAPGVPVIPEHGPGLPPGATPLPPPGSVPSGALPLPAPLSGQPPLQPVPNGTYAQPTPATPSSRGGFTLR